MKAKHLNNINKKPLKKANQNEDPYIKKNTVRLSEYNMGSQKIG